MLKFIGFIFASLVAVVIIAILIIFLGSDYYLYTENKNFKNARKERERFLSEIDCAALPIHCAIRDNKLDKIPDIITNGFSVNAQDKLGNTALFFLWKAVNKSDYTSFIEILLKAGENPNIGDKGGNFPLEQAINRHDYDTAKMFIKYGASPNIKIGVETKKMTLLTEYVTRKDIEVAEFLVNNGADITIKDDYGYNACERANMYKITNLFKFCNLFKEK